MAFGDEDLAYMLGEDFGVTVSYGGVSTVGIVDEAWQAVLEGQAIAESATHRTVVIATGSIAPVQGGLITVGGAGYAVVDLLKEGPDGRLTRVLLAAVESITATAALTPSSLSITAEAA